MMIRHESSVKRDVVSLVATGEAAFWLYHSAMSDIVVFISLTLDGVMQAPGRADEDTRGGFQHGGWGCPTRTPTRAGSRASRWPPPGRSCWAGEPTKTSIRSG